MPVQKHIDTKKLVILETTTFMLTAGGQAALRNIYEAAGGNLVAGLFGEVNDSVWEHMKIVFFAFVFFAVIEYFASGVNFKRFFSAKAAACVFLFFSVPLYLYVCTFIAGQTGFVPDVAGLFTLTAIAFLFSFKLIVSRLAIEKGFIIWVACLCVLLALFMTLTVFALPADIFKDPKTGDYGLCKRVFTVSYNTNYT